MQTRLTTLITAIAIFGLAACGGGGDGGGGGGTSVPGTNGLNYAAAGQNITDAEGTPVTATATQLRDGSLTTETVTITVDPGFLDTGELDGSATFFGETVNFVNGSGQLSNGQEVIITFDPTQTGTYAAAVQLSSNGATSAGATDGELAIVFGFETNPDTIASMNTGSVLYSGAFVATGEVTEGATTTTGNEMEGTLEITVNFAASNTFSAALEGTYDVSGPTTVNLTSGTQGFTGNDFNGALSCTSGCNGSGGSIDGTFYGPQADEVGGVLTLNTDTGTSVYIGVGTFIIVGP